MPGSLQHLIKAYLSDGLGKEVSVFLVWSWKELLFLPKFWTQVTVGCLEGMVHSLDEVTHGTRVTTGGGVAITDSSHPHELLSNWGGNKSSTTRCRDKSHADRTRLSCYLTWYSVRHTSFSTPSWQERNNFRFSIKFQQTNKQSRI